MLSRYQHNDFCPSVWAALNCILPPPFLGGWSSGPSFLHNLPSWQMGQYCRPPLWILCCGRQTYKRECHIRESSVSLRLAPDLVSSIRAQASVGGWQPEGGGWGGWRQHQEEEVKAGEQPSGQKGSNFFAVTVSCEEEEIASLKDSLARLWSSNDFSHVTLVPEDG